MRTRAFNMLSALVPIGIGVLVIGIGHSFNDWFLRISGAICLIYGAVTYVHALIIERLEQRAKRLRKLVDIILDYDPDAHARAGGRYEGLHFSPQSYRHNPEDMVGYPSRPLTDDEIDELMRMFGPLSDLPPHPEGPGPWIFDRTNGEWIGPR